MNWGTCAASGGNHLQQILRSPPGDNGTLAPETAHLTVTALAELFFDDHQGLRLERLLCKFCFYCLLHFRRRTTGCCYPTGIRDADRSVGPDLLVGDNYRLTAGCRRGRF